MSITRAPRPWVGLVVGVGLVAAITGGLTLLPDDVSLATPGIMLVLPVLASALLGGRRSSIAVATLAALALSFAFITPTLTLRIDRAIDAVAFVVFLAVASTVGGLVSEQTERRRDAERQSAEIARMHDALVTANAEAQRAAVLEQVDRHRASLLRAVSHDLRTPLVTVRGVASDLRHDDVYDTATRNDLLDLVIAETDRLDRIVGNLLSLSQIDAGVLRVRRERVAVGELVDATLRRLARRGPVRLHADVAPDLPDVRGDPALLDQTIANLVENALRHGGPDVDVTVAATRRDGHVEIVVCDDGPGIHPDVRDELFEPWKTGPSSPGSGIGLAVCRSVVEAHGGTIRTLDVPAGACFVLTLEVFDDAC